MTTTTTTKAIHTPSGKREFMRELVGNVLSDALAKAENMPEEWDGHELRRYLADKFEDAAFTMRRGRGAGPIDPSYRTRYRAYRNEILTRGDL